MKIFRSFIVFIVFAVVAAVATFAATSDYGSGIGRSGTTTLNISADSPGALKYHLEFKPLGGSRQVNEGDYSDTQKNFATSLNIKCLEGGECSKDESYVRGVYIVGVEGAYAIAKKFTLFCGSIQVVGEQRTNTWDSSFYNSFADDFLTNGPSSGNCPSPTTTPVAATVTPTGASTNKVSPTSSTKLKTSPTPEPTDEQEKDKPDEEETPTPTPEEEGTSFVDSFTQNLPLYIAGLVLLGVLGYVLYQKNSGFKAMIDKLFKKNKKNSKIDPTKPPPEDAGGV